MSQCTAMGELVYTKDETLECLLKEKRLKRVYGTCYVRVYFEDGESFLIRKPSWWNDSWDDNRNCKELH